MSSTNASNVLKDFWDGSLPVDPYLIAFRMDIRIILDPTLNTSGDYKEGMFGDRTISVNPNHAETHNRFTVAHEIGHSIYGHDGACREMGVTNNQEVMANNFAAELLMPEDYVHAMINDTKEKNLHQIARQFKVSIKAMTIRLERLGYVIT